MTSYHNKKDMRSFLWIGSSCYCYWDDRILTVDVPVAEEMTVDVINASVCRKKQRSAAIPVRITNI